MSVRTFCQFATSHSNCGIFSLLLSPISNAALTPRRCDVDRRRRLRHGFNTKPNRLRLIPFLNIYFIDSMSFARLLRYSQRHPNVNIIPFTLLCFSFSFKSQTDRTLVLIDSTYMYIKKQKAQTQRK